MPRHPLVAIASVTAAVALVMFAGCRDGDVTAPQQSSQASPPAAPTFLISGSPTIAPQVSAGAWHTCAVKTDGTVVCWGDNEYGEATVPSGLTSVAQVSTGAYHTCALKTDGTLI